MISTSDSRGATCSGSSSGTYEEEKQDSDILFTQAGCEAVRSGPNLGGEYLTRFVLVYDPSALDLGYTRAAS